MILRMRLGIRVMVWLGITMTMVCLSLCLVILYGGRSLCRRRFAKSARRDSRNRSAKRLIVTIEAVIS